MSFAMSAAMRRAGVKNERKMLNIIDAEVYPGCNLGGQSMKAAIISTLALCLALAGCQNPGQNVYGGREVGKAALALFGVIVAQREVDVVGRNSGLGALGGGLAGAGAVAASGGTRGGGLAAAAGGAVLGALLEQAAANRKATEFVIALENRQTITLVQDHLEGDAPLNVGDRVMVQVMGKTQRVLPAAALPTEAQRPKGIKLVD